MELSDLVLPDVILEPKIITCTIEGILEASDLRELTHGIEETAATDKQAARSGPAPEFIPMEEPTDLVRIRERHHSVARLIANGMSQGLVAQICGYQQAYLSTLLNAPAMRELVSFYRIKNGAAAEVITERLKTVGLKAIDKIEDKLETEDMSGFELAAIAKLGLDRSGHGPSSTQHVIKEEHIVDHAELQRLNADALRRSKAVTVSMSEVRKALPSPADNPATGTSEEGVVDAGA